MVVLVNWYHFSIMTKSRANRCKSQNLSRKIWQLILNEVFKSAVSHLLCTNLLLLPRFLIAAPISSKSAPISISCRTCFCQFVIIKATLICNNRCPSRFQIFNKSWPKFLKTVKAIWQITFQDTYENMLFSSSSSEDLVTWIQRSLRPLSD